MKLADILEAYSAEALDQLAADKIDEVAGLRLPRPVLEQQCLTALGSISYVARALAPAKPPTYAILKLLMDAAEHRLPAEGFRDRVATLTAELTALAADSKALSGGKNYELYLEIVATAWENDGVIDRSEALLLEALRNKLGIWSHEHLVLEHHQKIRPLWETHLAFDVARNHLLATGLVLTSGEDYVIADEVCRLVRRVWGIELEDANYVRLLSELNVNQLRTALEAAGLPLSGTKDERVTRLVTALVPPAQVLDSLLIDEVKDVCRARSLPVSGPKAELVASIVEHFDRWRPEDDLPVVEEPERVAPPEPEPRRLLDDEMTRLFRHLTLDQLHDILSAASLRRSGTKEERVATLVASPYAAETLLGHLAKGELKAICQRLNLRLSGLKDDLIDRLVEFALLYHETGHGDDIQALVLEHDTPVEPMEAIIFHGEEHADWAARAGLPGFHGIQADYPELSHDEQVVLALLKRARSLTEAELERAGRQHDLGWVLTKAHMAELMDRLTASGRSPVRVRSAAGANIYEWVGALVEDAAPVLEREHARDVIDAVRQGVVPEKHLELLAVGQEAAREHLVGLLEHVRTGRSEFKFICGQYGAGKTFLCAWLRERAFDAGFAVASIRVGPDQPLSDLAVLYAGLLHGLRTPEKRDSTALADILESWLLNVHRRAAQVEGVAAFGHDDREMLTAAVEQQIESELASLRDLDPSFVPALRHFYRARLEGDAETVNTALAWLRGSRALSADALRRIGVRGYLEGDQVFPRVRALLKLIGDGRLRGLLVLVDELELVRRFPQARQRERAYETLRLLIDEAGENALPGCLMIFTGTEQLFGDERYGLRSYEALSNRIAPPSAVADGRFSVRQPIIPLEPLDAERLLAVARRVREIHAVAYNWPAEARVPDEILTRLVHQSASFAGGDVARLPRPFLRELVHLLDLCEENPSISAAECLRPAASELDLAASVTSILE